jgi:ArsR family transcriptional regulator
VATEHIQSSPGGRRSCGPPARRREALLHQDKREPLGVPDRPDAAHGTRATLQAARRDPRPVYAAKADLFRTLGHPARVRIIELLRDGERSVGSLQGALGLDSSGTSQHLALLRKHGLVSGRRDGTTVYYHVTEDAVFGLLEAARVLLGSILGRQQAELAELAGSLTDDVMSRPDGTPN